MRSSVLLTVTIASGPGSETQTSYSSWSAQDVMNEVIVHILQVINPYIKACNFIFLLFLIYPLNPEKGIVRLCFWLMYVNSVKCLWKEV